MNSKQLTATEMIERIEGFETRYEPGRGSAHDYIPGWMNVPPLYASEDQADALAVIKLFTPDSSWSWYITEYDGDDTMFGLVVGHETEFGYVSLAEIRAVTGPMGLKIERDLWFEPTRVTQLAEYQKEWGEFGGPYKGIRVPANQDRVNAEVQQIKEREGDPCSVIVREGQIVEVVTPRFLLRMWDSCRGDVTQPPYDEQDDREHDEIARSLFRGGDNANGEFQRFCRVAIQGLLLGRSIEACFLNYGEGVDFKPSPSWEHWRLFVGDGSEKMDWIEDNPKFEIGDAVHYTFTDSPDTERWSILKRQWREESSAWYYHVSGKWWSESSLVAAGPLHGFTKGDKVWWETREGVLSGCVKYVYDTYLTVDCNQAVAVGGVPIGRIEQVDVDKAHRGDPPEILTGDDVTAIFDETTIAVANAVETETEDPPNLSESVPLPDGWTVEDVEFLLSKLDEGHCVLVADSKLGVPTIHDFTGVRHCGMGVMKVETPEYTLTFDAGASMERTPSGKGWTSVQVSKGEYGYPLDDVRHTLSVLVTRDRLVESDVDATDTTAHASLGGSDLSTWKYVPLVERKGKLATRFEGNTEALRGALTGKPSQNRVSLLLSALADAGWPAPPEYINIRDAGVTDIRMPYMDGQPIAPFEGQHVLHLKGTMRHPVWGGDVIRISGPIAPAKGVEAIGTWTAMYDTRDYGPSHFMCGNEIAVQADSAEECTRRLEELLQGFGHQIQITLDHSESHLPDDVFGEPVHTLTFGDNGSQVYFEGDQYLVLNPYTDQDGQRYGSGWSWYFRSETETDGEWRLLPDPDLEGCYVGSLSLSEAVLYAQRVELVKFDLVGAPDDLPDKYPKPLYDNVREIEGPSRRVEAKPKKRKLPDDIPDTIEVDMGHFKGWAVATAERIKGRWLHYRLPDGQTGKVQIIGRDMLWRVPAGSVEVAQ